MTDEPPAPRPPWFWREKGAQKSVLLPAEIPPLSRALLSALKCVPACGPSCSSPGAWHKGPVVGPQPRRRQSPCVTHDLAISFVWPQAPCWKPSVPAAWGRGRGGRSPASPLREGDPRCAFHVAGGLPAHEASPAQPRASQSQRLVGPARCLQPPLGTNQSGRCGGGMWSPSGIPPGPLNEHIFLKSEN